MNDDLSFISLVVCFLGLIVAAILWLSSEQCHAKWTDSGMKSQWSVLGGCKVQRKDGTWVPSSSIRELSP